MSARSSGVEGTTSLTTEKNITRIPPTPITSPYLETQKKAQREFKEFTQQRFSKERNNPTNFDEQKVAEQALGNLLDTVVTSETGRITDTSDIKKLPQLDKYINDTEYPATSIALVASLNEIPENTSKRDTLVRDIMRVRVLRGFNQVKNLGAIDTRLQQEDIPPDDILSGIFPEGEERKLSRYISEMKRFGVDGVEIYYKTIDAMSLHSDVVSTVKSSGEIDTLAHIAAQKIRNLEIPREEKIILESEIALFAKGRRERIKGHTRTIDAHKYAEKLKKIKMEGKEFLEDYLEPSLQAYDYFTDDKTKNKVLKNMPARVARLLVDIRNIINKVDPEYVTSDLIARYGWQLRTGRPEELVAVFEKYKQLAITPDFNRFVDTVKDEYLQTEASGFEIHENVQIRENVSTEALLREGMNSLLKIHRPRGQQKVYFTVFYGENKMQKIAVNTKEDITSEELDDNIAQALELSKINDVNLTFQERADLGYQRYSMTQKERDADETYKRIYKHGINSDINGDYVIQIKGHTDPVEHTNDTTNEHSAQTILAVDDHQMALLLDKRSYLNGVPALKSCLRYKHSQIDGIPAYAHSQKVLTALRDLKAKRYSSLSGEIYKDLEEHIESLAPTDVLGVPQLEGRATYKEQNEPYPSLQISFSDTSGEKKSTKLSPAFTRSLIYALANDVDVFHYLHASSKENDLYFDERGDRFDSLQPIYTSFNHLKEEFKKWKGEMKGEINAASVKDWLQQYAGLKARADKGYSDLFVIAAAPPGNVESQFAAVSMLVHGGASMLSSPQGGMYSGLPPQPESESQAIRSEEDKHIFDTEFSSAQASIYNNIEIDLFNAQPCMGVVGYLQRGDVAVSTCRKTPCQAQETFKTEFLKLSPEELKGKKQEAFLKQFNPLLEKWDGLLKGGNTLTDYIDARKSIFEKLFDEDAPTRETLADLGYTDQISFQKYLDRILQKSAEDTFGQNEIGQNKVAQTKEAFIGFMQAAGVTVTTKEKKK